MSPNPRGPAVVAVHCVPAVRAMATPKMLYAAIASGQRPSRPNGSEEAHLAPAMSLAKEETKLEAKAASDAGNAATVVENEPESDERGQDGVSLKEDSEKNAAAAEERPERVLRPLKSISELSQCLKPQNGLPVTQNSLSEGPSSSTLNGPPAEQRPMSKKARSRLKKRLKKQEEEAAAAAALLAQSSTGDNNDSERPRNLMERGIENRGNSCYANAVMQALLHCGPFYRLLTMLHGIRLPVCCPVTDRL